MEQIPTELSLPPVHRRFYDRMRRRIEHAVEKKKVVGKAAEFLMLVPDIFVLLWRLTIDRRVKAKNKALLGGAVLYFVIPFDLLPEALVGPIGYLDDLIFAVYVLNKILGTTDPAVLREHWSGRGDVLETMQRVLHEADTVVDSKVMAKLKKMV